MWKLTLILEANCKLTPVFLLQSESVLYKLSPTLEVLSLASSEQYLPFRVVIFVMATRTKKQSSAVSQDSVCTTIDKMEDRVKKERLMSRGSLLMAVTPGSCLARRIMYSHGSKLPQTKRRQVTYKSRQEDAKGAINQTHLLPRLVNPKSSFAKRHKYMIQLKGVADPLSLPYREYVANKSMIDTWLQNRLVREVKKLFKEKHGPCSCIAIDQHSKTSSDFPKAHSFKSGEKLDALPNVARKHFPKANKAQTWEKERIAREINATIDKKFKDLFIPTSSLHPSKQFIDEAYLWMKTFNVGQEELYNMVEQHWVSPRYSRYRREIIESLLLSEYFIHT